MRFVSPTNTTEQHAHAAGIMCESRMVHISTNQLPNRMAHLPGRFGRQSSVTVCDGDIYQTSTTPYLACEEVYLVRFRGMVWYGMVEVCEGAPVAVVTSRRSRVEY